MVVGCVIVTVALLPGCVCVMKAVIVAAAGAVGQLEPAESVKVEA